jgi:hypothetical protein
MLVFHSDVTSVICTELNDGGYLKAMEKEHESKDEFKCSCNLYKTPTSTPAKEWALVVDEATNKDGVDMRDRLLPLDEYIKIGKEYTLRKEEVISLVLASGPMV